MEQNSSPIAFLSYVRKDDEHTGGWISQFREHLSNEVEMQTGSAFEIFQDRNDIKWGENWRMRIDESLNTVTFLLAVVTPRFFMSPECRGETDRFLRREAELHRNDLVLPVYYVDCPRLNDAAQRRDDPLAEAIFRHNYVDWREIRFEAFSKPEIRRQIAKMAEHIRDALGRPMPAVQRRPPPPPRVRIFLSSPGDVAEERQIARQLIERELPKRPQFRERIRLEVIAWDDPAARLPMLASMTPQELVNAQERPRPADCDIVIVILWARIGTPLPENVMVKPNGEPYLSGTEWEYEDAINAPEGHRPDVLVYRRTEKPMIDIDDPVFDEKRAQFRAVQAFFARFRHADGSLQGGVNEYATLAEFEAMLRQHLEELIYKRLVQPRAYLDNARLRLEEEGGMTT